MILLPVSSCFLSLRSCVRPSMWGAEAGYRLHCQANRKLVEAVVSPGSRLLVSVSTIRLTVCHGGWDNVLGRRNTCRSVMPRSELGIVGSKQNSPPRPTLGKLKADRSRPVFEHAPSGEQRIVKPATLLLLSICRRSPLTSLQPTARCRPHATLILRHSRCCPL